MHPEIRMCINLAAAGTTSRYPFIDPGRPFCGEDVVNWILLVVAGLFEIGWAVGLKYTEGFTRFWPTAGTVAAMVVSIALLGVAIRELPVGTAYAVWTGIGAVGTVILGMVLFGDSATWARLSCLGLILTGIAGLKVLA
jgi:quaternary ammonium compound-resistance protein SugE